MVQDLEARDLSARWLVSDQDAAYASVMVPTFGIDKIAASLRIRPAALRIRLGLACRCLTNISVYRGEACGCRIGRAA